MLSGRVGPSAVEGLKKSPIFEGLSVSDIWNELVEGLMIRTFTTYWRYELILKDCKSMVIFLYDFVSVLLSSCIV